MKTGIRHLLFLAACAIFGEITVQAQSDASSRVYAMYNHAAKRQTVIAPYGQAFPDSTNYIQARFDAQTTDGLLASGEWFGSATLAVSKRSEAFYFAERTRDAARFYTQRRSGERQWLNSGTGKQEDICLTKMATGPDGYVYAISTSTRGGTSKKSDSAVLVRYCLSKRSGRAELQVLGYLQASQFDANLVSYSGDMAFSSTGDLYIFGTALDPLLHHYKGSHIIRIQACKIPKVKGHSAIPVEYLGRISGMGTEPGIDSTIITGVAFETGGHFVLATMDRQAGQKIRFYRGKIQLQETKVYPLGQPANIPDGFVVSDLASAVFPLISLQKAKTPALTTTITGASEQWEQSLTIKTFHF